MEALGISSSGLQADFLTLLVTQLQNQDPIEPVNQEQFIAQLAQFSMVEGIENLNVQFQDVLYSQQQLNGFNLVDKNVSYVLPGDESPRTGHVTEVFIEQGRINVVVDDAAIPISQVIGVLA